MFYLLNPFTTVPAPSMPGTEGGFLLVAQNPLITDTSEGFIGAASTFIKTSFYVNYGIGISFTTKGLPYCSNDTALKLEGISKLICK